MYVSQAISTAVPNVYFLEDPMCVHLCVLRSASFYDAPSIFATNFLEVLFLSFHYLAKASGIGQESVETRVSGKLFFLTNEETDCLPFCKI